MAREVGVAAVPGSSFFNEPVPDPDPLPFCKENRDPRGGGQAPAEDPRRVVGPPYFFPLTVSIFRFVELMFFVTLIPRGQTRVQ